MSAVLRSRREHRSAVLVAPGTFEMCSTELPQPGAGEVRVRLEGCGICASSLPVWEGRPWFKYPLESGTPGHEGWGRIDELGVGAEGFAIGDRVAFVSNHAFAQFDVAPTAAVVRLPRELNDQPFPGEPLGCAMNIFERSDIRAGMSVAIVGGGFLGTLLTQLATHAGAEVCVISHREYSLQVAQAAGAAHVFSSADANVAKTRALEITGGRGFERVIEAAGVQSTLDLASALTAEGARLVIAGYHQDGLRQVNLQEWNWRGIDVINAHERATERYAAGIRAAAQAVLDGRIDPFPLLTHALPLGELERGFELTRSRPDGFIKAIVTMEQAS
jgi:threonine dehydrogenase-like Zn-dependent dehydrogenase